MVRKSSALPSKPSGLTESATDMPPMPPAAFELSGEPDLTGTRALQERAWSVNVGTTAA